jgi:hypothetical protein
MKNLIVIAMAMVALMLIGVFALPAAFANALVIFGAGNLLLCLGFMFIVAKVEGI